ncbi:hypothetical protein SAMN05421767_10630 [Granulicatella balaenopterae]|uniref:Uncharacterized protein n=1 Tax=Granulicatella balaenopterae TaxID=137733 RepID=A0A1H9IMM8_9LACT|nr:hypothetical protein [Granulicatella balaenopterae]SEQ75742.1 hypothetical protein SAMN05421767_10630 [Granulicatella balaenopterae]
MEKLQKEHRAIKKEYLNKFGANSLKRVILPLTVSGTDEERREDMKETIKMLKQAIEANEPIEQSPPHLWNKIYF